MSAYSMKKWNLFMRQLQEQKLHPILNYDWLLNGHSRVVLSREQIKDPEARIRWSGVETYFEQANHKGVVATTIRCLNSSVISEKPFVSADIYWYKNDVEEVSEDLEVTEDELSRIRRQLILNMSPRAQFLYKHMCTVRDYAGYFTLYGQGNKVFTGANQFMLLDLLTTSKAMSFEIVQEPT